MNKQTEVTSPSNPAYPRWPDTRKAKPLGDLCLEIAEFAKDRDYRTLDYLMRMAASEAYDQTSDSFYPSHSGKDELVGMWDWDVSNNRVYIDPPGATLFNVDSKAAVTGVPLEEYLKAIHPDDVAPFSKAVYAVAEEGGCFKATYRLINNGRIVWVFARGSCFVSAEKTPVRFPGALFDVTASMTNGMVAG